MKTLRVKHIIPPGNFDIWSDPAIPNTQGKQKLVGYSGGSHIAGFDCS